MHAHVEFSGNSMQWAAMTVAAVFLTIPSRMTHWFFLQYFTIKIKNLRIKLDRSPWYDYFINYIQGEKRGVRFPGGNLRREHR